MEETTINSSGYMDRINKEAPELVKLLKEMKEGLDTVRAKIETLTAKVKEDNYPTADGISYLEAKHLLLLNYCQSLVYYLLRKAKGFSIEGHPVVRSLVEIRLFLEKIRPIDKKLQYQIQKLTMVNRIAVEPIGSTDKKVDKSLEQKDFLDYRPKPELLLSKTGTREEDVDGFYRPPKFAPTNMEDDHEKISKEEKNAKRKEKHDLRRIRQSDFVKDLIDDHEGRPEEISENLGGESRELRTFKGKFEERMRREEELFTRAPLTREEKKQHKYMKRTQNGVQRIADEFFDDLKNLPVMESTSAPKTEFDSDFNHDTGGRGRGRGGRGRGRGGDSGGGRGRGHGGDSGGDRKFKKHKSKY